MADFAKAANDEIRRLRAALREAEAQRDALAQERAFAQANHAGFCPEMGEWRGRAEALAAALTEIKAWPEAAMRDEVESFSALVEISAIVRRALAGEPRQVSSWEFACGCSINSYGWDAEPMLAHDGCRVLSQAVKHPPRGLSGIRMAEPETPEASSG